MVIIEYQFVRLGCKLLRNQCLTCELKLFLTMRITRMRVTTVTVLFDYFTRGQASDVWRLNPLIAFLLLFFSVCWWSEKNVTFSALMPYYYSFSAPVPLLDEARICLLSTSLVNSFVWVVWFTFYCLQFVPVIVAFVMCTRDFMTLEWKLHDCKTAIWDSLYSDSLTASRVFKTLNTSYLVLCGMMWMAVYSLFTAHFQQR